MDETIVLRLKLKTNKIKAASADAPRCQCFGIPLKLIVGVFLIAIGSRTTHGGMITAQGLVTALSDVSQLNGLYGTATFDGVGTLLPLNTYTPLGMTFHTGTLTSILPGVTTAGSAAQPLAFNYSSDFPGTIGGGGQISGLQGLFAGVVTFSQTVTQFGLTAGKNGNQFITAWDASGSIIGQVNWEPSDDASFVGIDTGNVAIAMLAYGNDDLIHGATYDISGATIKSDNWKWASGAATVPEPASLVLWSLGLAVVAVGRRHPLACRSFPNNGRLTEQTKIGR